MDELPRTASAEAADVGGPGMALITRLDELSELVETVGASYVRYSAGPEVDLHTASRDGESGAVLPGLSVNRLQPEPWWDRPTREWIARRLAQYLHLGAAQDRYAWVLLGREVGRGPDSEPLLADVVPVAVIADSALREALELYRRAFTPGHVPEGP